MEKLSFDGPVVLAILDGVGLAPDGPGNAVSKARTLFLGQASQKYLHIALEASGEAVGLIPGQMGNSEVGHNTMGCGRAFKQGIARINEEFRTGKVFDSDAWRSVVTRLQHEESATLHFAGIFSDGGVHSHISHLEQMISKAYAEGIRKMRVHAVFDGRDVPPQSEPKFIKQLESFAQQFADADIKIASGGGRMVCVADRYENDWAMVERGWNMMVNAKADYYFQSAEEQEEHVRNSPFVQYPLVAGVPLRRRYREEQLCDQPQPRSECTDEFGGICHDPAYAAGGMPDRPPGFGQWQGRDFLQRQGRLYATQPPGRSALVHDV